MFYVREKNLLIACYITVYHARTLAVTRNSKIDWTEIFSGVRYRTLAKHLVPCGGKYRHINAGGKFLIVIHGNNVCCGMREILSCRRESWRRTMNAYLTLIIGNVRLTGRSAVWQVYNLQAWILFIQTTKSFRSHLICRFGLVAVIPKQGIRSTWVG